MGNEYGWRKERLRAEVLRRFWRTSIFITCSTCGSKCGVKSGRTAMLSSCDSLTISWLDSRARSEEHTSELQSRLHLVCRLLLEKKNTLTRLTPRSERRSHRLRPRSPLAARSPACKPTRRRHGTHSRSRLHHSYHHQRALRCLPR